MNSTRGIVYLVGAGPGDPGLLTRRGADVLARAEVVVYDHLANSRLLDLAPPQAIRIRAGKSIGHCTLDQDQINALLLEHARAGRVVVRLKGGDPLVFGRGAEEAEHLAGHKVPFEIVPGVTAGVGVTAFAGIPITHRDLSSAVAFVTGHGDPDAQAEQGSDSGPAERMQIDWPALARFPGTLVVYMGVTHLAPICRTLIKAGKDAQTPVAIIESGTLSSQRVIEGTLGTIADEARRQGVHPPSLLVVGTVVQRRSKLSWYESLPLFGQRIVVTRPFEEGGRAAAVLEAMGAEVLLAPTVVIRPISDPRPLDEAIGRLASYDWLVFTSGNGVRFFLDRLFHLGLDLRALGHLKLAAIGPMTAQVLTAFHLRADLVPESYRSEALAEALAGQAEGRRILLARANRGRSLLKDELRKWAQVDQLAVYENADAPALPEEVLERVEAGTVDWITLTSSAIATRLHELLPEAARRRVGSNIRLASISPVTSETVVRLGWDVAAQTSVHTWEGLVEAIVKRVSEARGGIEPGKRDSTGAVT
jgi:uroporphyrinogen III methyltransferase/synthase